MIAQIEPFVCLTRYGSIYTGTITNPIFNDLFAPVDGFVMNGGVKIRL